MATETHSCTATSTFLPTLPRLCALPLASHPNAEEDLVDLGSQPVLVGGERLAPRLLRVREAHILGDDFFQVLHGFVLHELGDGGGGCAPSPRIRRSNATSSRPDPVAPLPRPPRTTERPRMSSSVSRRRALNDSVQFRRRRKLKTRVSCESRRRDELGDRPIARLPPHLPPSLAPLEPVRTTSASEISGAGVTVAGLAADRAPVAIATSRAKWPVTRL